MHPPDTAFQASTIFSAMKDAVFPQRENALVSFCGTGALPSAFAVSDFAAAAIATAGLGVSQWLAALDGRHRKVTVDRRLASFWFAGSLRPDGWTLPSPWDAIAGDYRTSDGWIRLHTNAPHHRLAALRALGCAESREAVEAAVLGRRADDLEAEIVALGGCAAAMRSLAEWQSCPAGIAVRNEPLVLWQETGGGGRLLTCPQSTPRHPLAGLKVLDLTRVLAGPVASRFLALLGATVLRIDPPAWDEPGVLPEVMLGKESARLDLSKPADRDVFETLLAECDMLIHGYRPGALDDLGYGADKRAAFNPGMIEVSLDAYGWSGPWRGRRGFDSLVQMSTGIADAGMKAFGTDKPKPLPVQALDHATGYLMAGAALRSLTHAHTTGKRLSARLSLAKAADLLVRYRQLPTGDLLPETPSDVAPAIEQTGWGPARRLQPPLTIDGVLLQATRPAKPIGYSDPLFPVPDGRHGRRDGS